MFIYTEIVNGQIACQSLCMTEGEALIDLHNGLSKITTLDRKFTRYTDTIRLRNIESDGDVYAFYITRHSVQL